ncbi:hypothetical protein [Aquimarina algiphila]|uniref:hypothetical protein n=1 Tax=Aquimarina algiphila TaxID=2047982 RepID=UPI00249068EF|nr:hypothetical protein [Aquimarina algiphila]
MELWLRFGALHIEDSSVDGSEEHKIRDQWLIASRGCFNGCVPDGIDEAVSTDIGRKIVTDAIYSLLAELKKAPDKLDRNVLNLMGCGEWIADFETYRLIELSEAILDLIDGKVGSGPEDTSFMLGCR